MFCTFKKMFQHITFDSQKPEVLDRKWKKITLRNKVWSILSTYIWKYLVSKIKIFFRKTIYVPAWRRLWDKAYFNTATGASSVPFMGIFFYGFWVQFVTSEIKSMAVKFQLFLRSLNASCKTQQKCGFCFCSFSLLLNCSKVMNKILIKPRPFKFLS